MTAPSGVLPITASPSGTARRPQVVLLLLVALLVMAFAAELLMGTVAIAPADVLALLMGRADADDTGALIVRTVRLPRALTAALGGATLGGSGLLLQTLFRNRLAGPWILGVTGGARVGVAVWIVLVSLAGSFVPARLGIGGSIGVALAAGCGAAATLAFMAIAARRIGSVSLLILGLMLTFLAGGLTSVLLHLVPEDQGRVWEAWNDGNFGGVTWANLRILAPLVLLGLGSALLLVKPLDAFQLGERYAESMGVPVRRVRQIALCAVSAMAGAVTAFCGVVAFLDVAVPQLARGLCRTSEHRVLLPAAMLLGAAMALCADLLTHLPGGNRILHLNAIAAVIGAPVVIWIVFRRPDDG
ncbi:MAG: iron ABC transporter permease [Gemmatimonadaceae bacterium]|jgi:iron complex transport system permease protein|nr:iron ABC transporter permease [Gemmatimonadaceae bacterium]